MIYVCSDIHGCINRYKHVISKITDKDILYIIGDIIDRGSYGIEILQDIIKRNNVMALLGNHELMMYSSIRLGDEGELNNWTSYRNGGGITYHKFNELTDNEQEEILNYIGKMPLFQTLHIHDKNYYLSHGSFINSKKNICLADIDDIDNIFFNETYIQIQRTVWETPARKPYLLHQYTGYDVYIHGHVYTQAINGSYQSIDIKCNENKPFIIKMIDGGCACISREPYIKTALTLYNLSEDSFEYFQDDETIVNIDDIMEYQLPEYLRRSLDNWKSIMNHLENELNWKNYYNDLLNSINIAETEYEISSQQAWYLKEKYLGISQEEEI